MQSIAGLARRAVKTPSSTLSLSGQSAPAKLQPDDAQEMSAIRAEITSFYLRTLQRR